MQGTCRTWREFGSAKCSLLGAIQSCDPHSRLQGDDSSLQLHTLNHILITEQKSPLAFSDLSARKAMVAAFYSSLIGKSLIQQAAHLLPLKSSFPIDIRSLQAKRVEAGGTFYTLG